jgi:hypothetical protein
MATSGEHTSLLLSKHGKLGNLLYRFVRCKRLFFKMTYFLSFTHFFGIATLSKTTLRFKTQSIMTLGIKALSIRAITSIKKFSVTMPIITTRSITTLRFKTLGLKTLSITAKIRYSVHLSA